jgi:hypothetical protein
MAIFLVFIFLVLVGSEVKLLDDRYPEIQAAHLPPDLADDFLPWIVSSHY